MPLGGCRMTGAAVWLWNVPDRGMVPGGQRVNQRMEKDRPVEYFSTEYFRLHPGKRRYCTMVADQLRRTTPAPSARVLDVGCGLGLLMGVLEERGFATCGIDSQEEAIARARPNCAGELVRATADEELPFPAGTFDAVVMNDVIEHVADPAFSLEEAHRVLLPRGILFVATLNGHSISRWLMGKRWTWHLDPTHRHIFTPRSLSASLRKAGFTVERSHVFLNFSQVGEASKWLRPLRAIGRPIPCPFIGDSFYIVARRP